MADRIVRTTQGKAWDQLALESVGTEKRMPGIVKGNPEEADVLLFSGDVSVAVPTGAPSVPATETLPPWERPAGNE